MNSTDPTGLGPLHPSSDGWRPDTYEKTKERDDKEKKENPTTENTETPVPNGEIDVLQDYINHFFDTPGILPPSVMPDRNYEELGTSPRPLESPNLGFNGGSSKLPKKDPRRLSEADEKRISDSSTIIEYGSGLAADFNEKKAKNFINQFNELDKENPHLVFENYATGPSNDLKIYKIFVAKGRKASNAATYLRKAVPFLVGIDVAFRLADCRLAAIDAVANGKSANRAFAAALAANTMDYLLADLSANIGMALGRKGGEIVMKKTGAWYAPIVGSAIGGVTGGVAYSHFASSNVYDFFYNGFTE